MKKYLNLITIILLITFLDLFTKFFFKGKNLILIPKILYISYSQNPGILFGLFSNNFLVTVILPLIIIIIFIYYFIKQKTLLIPIAFIIAGLLGNLIDRLIHGFVIDFIFIPIIPQYNISLFNLADFFLVLGVILILIYSRKEK